MLYAAHPRPESAVGWAPGEVSRLFAPGLEIYWRQQGEGIAAGTPASWYHLRKLA